MRNISFSSKEELINQAKEDNACLPGISWAIKQDSLETILKTIPTDYRVWCLRHGYSQFEEDCKWEKIKAWDWNVLLSSCPQYYKYCDIELLDWNSLTYLLPEHIKLFLTKKFCIKVLHSCKTFISERYKRIF